MGGMGGVGLLGAAGGLLGAAGGAHDVGAHDVLLGALYVMALWGVGAAGGYMEALPIKRRPPSLSQLANNRYGAGGCGV